MNVQSIKLKSLSAKTNSFPRYEAGITIIIFTKYLPKCEAEILVWKSPRYFPKCQAEITNRRYPTSIFKVFRLKLFYTVRITKIFSQGINCYMNNSFMSISQTVKLKFFSQNHQGIFQVSGWSQIISMSIQVK